MARITKKIIKNNIKTINNGNYKNLEKNLKVTSEEIDKFIKDNFLDNLSSTTIEKIRQDFYKNGSNCNDREKGTKALANKHFILEKHVKELLEPKTSCEWEAFLDIAIKNINKRKDSFYAGRKVRIPEQKKTLGYLYKKCADLTDVEKQEIKTKFDNEGRNEKAIEKIANEQKLYFEDVTEIVEEITDEEWEKFFEQNISVINSEESGENEGIGKFKYTIPNSKQIEERLGARLLREIDFDELLEKKRQGENINFIEVANEKKLYYKQLERIMRYKVYLSVFERLDTNVFKALLSEKLLEEATQSEKDFLDKEVTEFCDKLVTFIGMQGFRTNMLNINSGVMTANAGDAAQFLFIARAIMLGFNCSNVDVRSSRYDAVIDYEGVILKIQIKGISDEVVKFKDRDRGGNGNDHNNISNIGKYISSEECDLYVAVDKQFGICYIIPVEEYIEPLDRATKRNGVKLSELSQFKENWNIIISLAQKKK